MIRKSSSGHKCCGHTWDSSGTVGYVVPTFLFIHMFIPSLLCNQNAVLDKTRHKSL
jgi:hypothetical protein